MPIAENEYVVKSPFDDDLYQIQYQFPPSVKHPDGEIRTKYLHRWIDNLNPKAQERYLIVGQEIGINHGGAEGEKHWHIQRHSFRELPKEATSYFSTSLKGQTIPYFKAYPPSEDCFAFAVEIESEDVLLGSDIRDASVINYGKSGNLAPASLVDKYIKEKNPFFEYHLSKKDFKDLGNFFDQNNLHVYRGDPGELVTVDEIIPTLAQYLMEQLKGRQDKKSYELEDFSDLDKFMSDNGFVFKESSGTYEIYPSDFLVQYIRENILTKKALEFQKYRIEKEDFEKFLEDKFKLGDGVIEDKSLGEGHNIRFYKDLHKMLEDRDGDVGETLVSYHGNSNPIKLILRERP